MNAVQRKIGRKKSLARRLSEDRRIQAAATVVLPVLLGILIFGLWQGGVLQIIFHTDSFTLPVPTKIGALFRDNFGKVAANARDTVTVALAGLIIGSLVGYGAAVLASFFPNMGKGGLSIVGAFASIPVVALAPVMNNWTRDVSTEASSRSMAAKNSGRDAHRCRGHGAERIPRTYGAETVRKGFDGYIRGAEADGFSEASASEFRTVYFYRIEGVCSGKHHDGDCK